MNTTLINQKILKREIESLEDAYVSTVINVIKWPFLIENCNKAKENEIDARRKVALLNANIMEWAKIDSLDVELMTYYIIFQSAQETKAKQEALFRLENAMILTGQNRQQQESDVLKWMQNASASQMTSASLQWAGQQKASLQTI